MDDVAAQVYVEQFALETFQRAENAMRANKVSRYEYCVNHSYFRSDVDYQAKQQIPFLPLEYS